MQKLLLFKWLQFFCLDKVFVFEHPFVRIWTNYLCQTLPPYTSGLRNPCAHGHRAFPFFRQPIKFVADFGQVAFINLCKWNCFFRFATLHRRNIAK